MNVREILIIIVSTVIVYIVVLVVVRLIGKKNLAQLGITDIIFIVLIGGVFSDAMLATHNLLPGALVAGITLTVLNKAFNMAMYRFPRFRSLIEGNPAVLVYEGVLNLKEMERNQVTKFDIEQAGREHGIARIADIKFALLEVDGKISILDTHEIDSTVPINGLKNENRKGQTHQT